MKILRPLNPILIVEDEEPIINGYRLALQEAGLNNLVCCTDSRDALAMLQKQVLDAVLLDLNMPHITGEEILEEIVKWQPGVPVIVVTGRQDVGSAVQCMKKGAYDYLLKPVTSERILVSLQNALKLHALQFENEQLTQSLLTREIRQPAAFAEIITQNEIMWAIFQYIETIAGSEHPVLITGETGTGKELLAKSIHALSGRSGQFVAVNVAGLDDTMFSDTLFGHKKGAFTGADSARAGVIAVATGGTLFLDEIGDLALASQIKLLRLLQEQEYSPLGEDTPVKTNIRVVVATNAALEKLLAEEKFRPDLFYRLNTHKITIPPLRKRLDDLPLLVNHFLRKASGKLKKKTPTTPLELIALLSEYNYPGNIRELEAMVTDAVCQHSSRILSMKVFKEYIDAKQGRTAARMEVRVGDKNPRAADWFRETLPSFSQVRRLLVEEALRRSDGNYSRAAELLGTSRQVLMWHLQKKSSAKADE